MRAKRGHSASHPPGVTAPVAMPHSHEPFRQGRLGNSSYRILLIPIGGSPFGETAVRSEWLQVSLHLLNAVRNRVRH